MKKETNRYITRSTKTIPSFDLLLTPEPSTISATLTPALPTADGNNGYDNRANLESECVENMSGTTSSSQQHQQQNLYLLPTSRYKLLCLHHYFIHYHQYINFLSQVAAKQQIIKVYY